MSARGAWGAGKIILLGEHAVIYGHPALAGALDLGVRVDARPGRLRLRVPAWQLDVDADDDHPAAAAVRLIADEIAARAAEAVAITMDDGLSAESHLERPAVELVADATVPAAAGLGSSAALAVAVTRALAAASGARLAADEVAEIANAAERAFHQRPSGVDVALASAGGLGVFRTATGLTRLPVPPLALAVGLSGEARSTATMVARVRDAVGGDARDPRLVALAACAEAGAAALGAGDVAALGPLFDVAHRHLGALGVSTPSLDRLVELARGAGALGAKLTGAGGGGAVIALAPGREADVVAAWRAAGATGMVVTVGASP
ncbi:MAG: mevalonate kinase [Kofleriaceae bacterium]